MNLRPLALAALLVVPAEAFAKDPVMTVTTGNAVSKETSTIVHGTGGVAAWKEVSVSPAVQGVVINSLDVEPGDVVVEGQALATLDDRSLRTAVERAAASLASSEAALSTATAAMARGNSLSSSRAVSQESIETLAAAVSQATAERTKAATELADARKAASDGILTSPVAGTVMTVSSNAGSTTGSTALVTVARDGRLEVASLIPERNLYLLAPGQKVSVTGLDGSVEEGEVRLVSPVVDAKTHLGTVWVSLPSGTRLRTGMFARVAIQAEPGRAIVVPAGAITYRSNSATVFAVGSDMKVRAVAVRPGSTVDGETSVSGSIVDGESVVVDGAGFVEDGDFVAVSGAAK